MEDPAMDDSTDPSNSDSDSSNVSTISSSKISDSSASDGEPESENDNINNLSSDTRTDTECDTPPDTPQKQYLFNSRKRRNSAADTPRKMYRRKKRPNIHASRTLLANSEDEDSSMNGARPLSPQAGFHQEHEPSEERNSDDGVLEPEGDTASENLNNISDVSVSSSDTEQEASGDSETEESEVEVTSDDDEDEGIPADDIFRAKIYPQSKLTVGVSCVLIMKFSRKYGLPRKGENDLLQLISLFCPENVETLIPKSRKQLLKVSMPVLQKTSKYKVCGTCCEAVNNLDEKCVNEHSQSPGKPTKRDTFFTHIPLEPQLKMLVEDNASEIAVAWRNQFDFGRPATGYTDITDGEVYKRICMEVHHDQNGAHLITLMISTDGAPVFKSVNCSIWPLYACVLELPINMRYSVKNVLLLGLWYGRKKPNPNVFLKPTLQEMDRLQVQGISSHLARNAQNFTQIIVRLHSLVCDLPGKAIILLFKLYNGKFGCMTCEHPGVRLAVRGNVRIYPYEKEEIYALRTTEKTRACAMLALESGTSVFGVKGYSVLHDYMDIPKGCPIDYMHCILQGTGKWIIRAILDSKNRSESFYLRPCHQKELSERLSQVAVPHDMDRKPRSLEFLKYWKASEIQHFLLYFGLPLLKEYLPTDHFCHLALLTTALWVLLKSPISNTELDMAGNMLQTFCRQMDHLYGERSQTINAHCLTHLQQQVKAMGPLWTHSAFAFEAMIAHTLKAYNGTRGAADQMVNNYLIDKEIRPLSQRLQESSVPEDVKLFSSQLSLSKPTSSGWLPVSAKISLSSSLHEKQLSQVQVAAIHSLIEETGLTLPCPANVMRKCSERMSNGGQVFHSTIYKRAGKSCSCIVQYNAEGALEYGEVQFFVCIGTLAIALIKPFGILTTTTICTVGGSAPTDRVVMAYANSMLLGGNHIIVTGPPGPRVKAIFCEDIRLKCIFVKAMTDVYGYVTPVYEVNCT